MAVDGEIPKMGYENGADDQFNFVSDENPIASSAVTVPEPGPGQTQTMTVTPGQALQVDFDVESAQVSGDGSQITMTLANGGTIVLQSPTPGAFTADPPVLLTPQGSFEQALQTFGVDGNGNQAQFTQAAGDNVFQFGSSDDAVLAGDAITVDRPEAGGTAFYEILPGQPLQLTFSLDDVSEILQTDNDIVLVFPTGEEVRFQSMVEAAFSDAPPILLMPDGGLVSAQELLSLGSDINALADALQGVDSAAGNSSVGPVTHYGDGSAEDFSGIGLGDIADVPRFLSSPPPPPPPPLFPALA